MSVLTRKTYFCMWYQYQVPPVPQAAHRAETIVLQSVCCIAKCFISDIVEIPNIEPSLMIDLCNVSLGLSFFFLPDGNQDKDCCIWYQWSSVFQNVPILSKKLPKIKNRNKFRRVWIKTTFIFSLPGSVYLHLTSLTQGLFLM
jgi:hypothetical protein